MTPPSSAGPLAHRAALVALVAAGALAMLPPPAAGKPRPIKRPADPVVLSGAAAPRLLGVEPGRVVGFTHRRRIDRWRQVPVQVDERARADLGDVYAGTRPGIEIDAYADAGTFTGADPNPALDADDEIALMAKHASRRRAPGRVKPPSGVRRGSGTHLKLRDPLDSRARGHLYLFETRDDRLDPAANRNLVSYEFRLLSGEYTETYRLSDGPNPERTTVSTPYYRLRFTDRWISDELEIRASGASGADIIDRRKVQFAPGVCGRSTDSFSDAEGAFVTTKDGPVRAIRSYVGANSGPLTQREHVFYERREEVTTFLRVHSIRGIIDFIDHAPTATGMVWRGEGQPDALVDGAPEQRTGPAPGWSQLTGAQGTLTSVNQVETDIEGLDLRTYYLDDTTPDGPDEVQCTGDGFAYGASGTWVASGIPNTDPLRGPAKSFVGRRSLFYDRPSLGREAAERRARWTEAPLRVRTLPR